MDSTKLQACKVKLPRSQRFTPSEKDPATISVIALNDDADTPIHPFLKMNNNPPYNQDHQIQLTHLNPNKHVHTG
eukprot:10614951-Ditylum_brightwellii.AAC.1